MVVLVNSVICCLGYVGKEASILLKLTTNIPVRFALNVALTRARKNSVKEFIFVTVPGIEFGKSLCFRKESAQKSA